MAIYGYIRVSTTRQAEDGESLGAQERTLLGYALMHGLSLDHVFIERGVSGSKPLEERPEGAKLLARLETGDTIITPKLDRLFRSALDALDTLAKLKDQGVALHMIDLGGDVTGNGISKLVFTILSAVAEAERDRIRERIADVKKDQRQRGRYLGGTIPFGYRVTDEGELVEVPEQLEAIKRMKAMRADGLSLRGIAQAMRQEGINLSHESVREILRRKSRGHSTQHQDNGRKTRMNKLTAVVLCLGLGAYSSHATATTNADFQADLRHCEQMADMWASSSRHSSVTTSAISGAANILGGSHRRS